MARVVTQDIVGTSAHEQARLVLCQVSNHIALNLEQRIVVQIGTIRDGTVADELETPTKQASQ